MKVKSDVFGITKGRRLFEKVLWLVLAVVCIGGVLFMMDKYVKDRTETVDIVKVGNKAITQDTLIENYHLTRYAIIKKEYNAETMFLWSELEDITGKYASYFIKEGTPIYKDSIFGEKRYRNEWMYEIEEGYEVLTIPFDYRMAGGNILVPGDSVRVRAFYESAFDIYNEQTKKEPVQEDLYDSVEEVDEEEVEEGTEEENVSEQAEDIYDEAIKNHQLISGSQDLVQVATIFEEMEVIDMLSNGASIYEKYLELKDMSESDRNARLADQDFMRSIIPDAMIVVVTEEQAMKYLQATAVDATLVFTILPRDMNNTILDKIDLIEGVADQMLEINSVDDQEGQ